MIKKEFLEGKIMKKTIVILIISMFVFNSLAMAAPQSLSAKRDVTNIKYTKNAPTITYAFVFDGPSVKNETVMKQFKSAITASTAPEFRAVFPANRIYTGNWSEQSAKSASNNALHSDARVVISLGYLSTKYLNSLPNKKKTVITIDQYGLRDLGDGFFNPVQQSVKSIALFDRLFHFKKCAILINESFYKTRKDWTNLAKTRIPNLDVEVVPLNTKNYLAVANSVKSKYDAVVLTPLYHLNDEELSGLIKVFNDAKIPTFSTVGKEDVELGALLGSGSLDLDRKIAEATSFNIKGVLAGKKALPSQIKFYEDQILYINKDTADLIGWDPHLRVMNNAEIITKVKPTEYNLSAVFNSLYENNLDIQRKRVLIKAARRASVAAVLKYLPTLSMTIGYQQYNHDYAESAKMSLPEKTGLFTLGVEQIIYSPALVTNILVKKKMLDFSKQEAFLTEQTMGIDVALLYVDTLMLENMIEIQKEYVKESRENLAIARVREQMGLCGQEEALRWAAQLNVNEQNLLDMKADLKNVKIAINKILFKNQTENYKLCALKANDPAFYTSEIKIIDYVTTPSNLEKFTQMLIEESYRVAPELAKLKAAIKIKDYEMAMYYQKFILPDAKLLLEYTSLGNRQFTSDTIIPAQDMRYKPGTPIMLDKPDPTNFRFGLFAQWKPIEGGTKIAEIARVKAERDELKLYETEVKTALEQHVRDTINNALAGYFSIEKNYKASFASGENYKNVKARYLKGDAPITQLIDAQQIYLDSKVKALNSQYVFFKDLLWVQRGICAVDWTHASVDAKKFIQKIKDELKAQPDIELL